MFKKGFTLIEFLVVIVIIGILAGVVIVSVSSATNSANDARRKADINQLVKAITIIKTTDGSLPTETNTNCKLGSTNSSENCSGIQAKLTTQGITIPKDPVSGNYYTYNRVSADDFTLSASMSDSKLYTYNSTNLNYSSENPIKTSCNAILNAGLSSGDGLYYIDPNGGDNSDKFQVYCDMTTDGGGWTRIISSSTTVADLQRYGNVSQITNFRSNASYGIGWGNNNATNSSGWNNPLYGLYSATIPFSFTSVRFFIYAPYNENATSPSYNSSGCLAETFIYDDNTSNDNEVFIRDGSADSSYGQTYFKRGISMLSSPQTVVNENVQYNDWSGKINLSIHGYYSGSLTYPVCNIFIGDLYVK